MDKKNWLYGRWTFDQCWQCYFELIKLTKPPPKNPVHLRWSWHWFSLTENFWTWLSETRSRGGARTKIDWDSDILHYFSVYLNGLGFFPVNFLSLVKRTIILVIFFSKFLIILAKSFENWPIFPWKTESWPFSSKFSMFSRYFSKKGLENLTNFWPICQKKISKESAIFSKSSRFHALCSKIFRKLTFFEWVNGLGFFPVNGLGLLNLSNFWKEKNYRSDFGRKSSERTEMIGVKFEIASLALSRITNKQSKF